MRPLQVYALLFLLVTGVSAFTAKHRNSGIAPTSHKSFRPNKPLFSSEEPSFEESKTSESQIAPPTPVEPEETSYPIDLPSPILLSTSMVLAIIGTGSAFDLAGGSPSLGFGTSAAIAGVSIPLCLFLFYASILKATAETEADDEEYMKGRY